MQSHQIIALRGPEGGIVAQISSTGQTHFLLFAAQQVRRTNVGAADTFILRAADAGRVCFDAMAAATDQLTLGAVAAEEAQSDLWLWLQRFSISFGVRAADSGIVSSGTWWADLLNYQHVGRLFGCLGLVTGNEVFLLTGVKYAGVDWQIAQVWVRDTCEHLEYTAHFNIGKAVFVAP